ncbi:unnamed protein product [Tuber melanosporum]|uniref:(Perigord truffle) hypothetical protein n=1 Tax=Tuber melanosporum (strain Mel28) TaxID=656061 RepID=D5GK79_TUBMM|nr:uncharacterized protein GSTUM_00009417001 [Tuber melanosporum]CAZ84922.1 unnamed protein product [Tuber melanosporum]
MLVDTRQGGAQDRFFFSEEEKRSVEGKQRALRTPPHRLNYRDPGFFSTPFFFPSFSFLSRVFPPDLSVPVNDATDEHQAFRWFLFPAAHFARLGERRFSSFVLGV